MALNITLLIFTFISYKEFKDRSLSIPDLNITTYEKSYLIAPVLFPALSVFGMHLMNSTGNNSIILLLYLSIVFYVLLVCFFNRKFPARLYPIVIFLISLSLLLLLSLRSNHIIGSDTHGEYYYFINILNNLYWSITGTSLYDATLSISLLPYIYQSILGLNPEFLFKILYSLLFFHYPPLHIYLISKIY